MADQLTIEKGKVVLTTEEGQRLERPEEKLMEMLRAEFLAPLNGVALPDGVKFYEWRPPLLLVVHQQPPHVRQFRWARCRPVVRRQRRPQPRDQPQPIVRRKRLGEEEGVVDLRHGGVLRDAILGRGVTYGQTARWTL